MITDEHSLSAHALIDHQNCKPFGELHSLNVVKFCKPQDLLKTEQFYTNKYNTHRPGGLNIDNPIGLSMLRLGRPVVMSWSACLLCFSYYVVIFNVFIYS